MPFDGAQQQSPRDVYIERRAAASRVILTVPPDRFDVNNWSNEMKCTGCFCTWLAWKAFDGWHLQHNGSVPGWRDLNGKEAAMRYFGIDSDSFNYCFTGLGKSPGQVVRYLTEAAIVVYDDTAAPVMAELDMVGG
jgi:hypothetical protein